MKQDEKTKVVIDETSIYEIDLECSRCNEQGSEPKLIADSDVYRRNQNNPYRYER